MMMIIQDTVNNDLVYLSKTITEPPGGYAGRFVSTFPREIIHSQRDPICQTRFLYNHW